MNGILKNRMKIRFTNRLAAMVNKVMPDYRWRIAARVSLTAAPLIKYL
ncbi:hypothetical protein [Lichenifustis flavocetrariae]|uniref:Uncharacterized protein n=1 Tax=Lichenifustis flavocetrariae TaxID=2949735 RepID=A0AA41YUM1_9HYPH|nr:hypothetical protein [Lichenifustis flavocetrariae]MCW6507342.1 hypothetical protein [Lichenifustis flavocetrariae]